MSDQCRIANFNKFPFLSCSEGKQVFTGYQKISRIFFLEDPIFCRDGMKESPPCPVVLSKFHTIRCCLQIPFFLLPYFQNLPSIIVHLPSFACMQILFLFCFHGCLPKGRKWIFHQGFRLMSGNRTNFPTSLGRVNPNTMAAVN